MVTRVKFRRGKYKEWLKANPVLDEGEIVVVTEIPWYKSWLGLKPTRLKYGIGNTFKKTRFL